MGKTTPRGRDADVYYNPNLVVSIEPVRDVNEQVVAPASCLVTLVTGATFELDGTVDDVVSILKVP